MKNLVKFLPLLFIALLLDSCASVHAGGANGTERLKYGNSGRSSAEMLPTRASNTLTSSEFGFYAGVFFSDIEIADKLELQPEVNFVAIKNLNQIHAPVYAKYNVSEQFSAFLGPNFGFLLDAGDGIKSFNLGGDIGVSYDLSENFLIEAKYNHGFSNLLENGDSNNSIKLSHIFFGIGYKFN